MVNIRPAIGHNGYLVYSDGRVFSKKSNRFLAQFLDNHGYLRVSITDNGKYKPIGVHRLVAEAFLDNPMNFDTVNHKDEDKTNNDVSNLEWLSNVDNARYGTAQKRSGITRRKPVEAYSNTETMKFASAYEAEEKGFGRALNILQAIRTGYISGGYRWRYSHDY